MLLQAQYCASDKCFVVTWERWETRGVHTPTPSKILSWAAIYKKSLFDGPHMLAFSGRGLASTLNEMSSLQNKVNFLFIENFINAYV